MVRCRKRVATCYNAWEVWGGFELLEEEQIGKNKIGLGCIVSEPS